MRLNNSLNWAVLATFVVVVLLCTLAVDEANGFSWIPTSGIKPACPFGHHIKTAPAKKDDVDEAPPSTEDPLLNVNNYFLSTVYPGTQQDLVNYKLNYSMVMLLTNDSIITYYNGTRSVSGPLTPEHYTNLKMVSHIALAAFTLLQPTAENYDGVVSPQVEQNINTYLELLAPAIPTIAERFYGNETVIQRQFTIINASVDLLNNVLQTKNASWSVLHEFAQSIVELINQNVYEATVAQLNVLHENVMDWQSNVPEEIWNELIVVLSASHMPRTLFEYLQYFARLLDTPQLAELRVIYAESLVAESDMLTLLGTHLNDWGSGMAFFNNISRMHIDLLAYATEAYLPTLLPTTPCCYQSNKQN